VEVLGRYSNLSDQGQHIRRILEIVPRGGEEIKVRTPKQVQRRLDAPEIERLKGAYQSGATLRDLAEEFHIHRHTAADLLERVGISRRGEGLSDSQFRQAIQLYGEGKSTATIGKTIGFNAETIRQRLLAAGIKIRGPHDWQQKGRP